MIKIVTEYPVAVDSFDHQNPKGAKGDNLENQDAVNKTVEKLGKDINYLDLGTAGGGIVKQFLGKDIHISLGIDGSDCNVISPRAAWIDIPDNLFTADISKPFHFEDDGEKVLFDLVSAFDVLEHLKEFELPGLLENLVSNIKVGGFFMASIANFSDENYHHTLQEKDWWIELFAKYDFEVDTTEWHYPRSSTHDITWKKVK